MCKDAFTVVSADNLDFFHSFIRVFCGKQTSSWHGTTLQVVQPLPSLSLPEYHDTSVGHAGRGEVPGSTHSGHGVIPGLSQTESGPSLAGHGEVPGSTHSGHGVIPGLSQTESGPSLTGHGEVPGSTHSGHGVIPGLSQTESGPSIAGHGEVPGSTHSGHGVIPGLSQTESGPSLTGHGEVPGSTHSGHGVIPGLSQAKLYEILKCLSFEYGEDLNWLIPYPGDFYLLLNFQKALMKPYFDAGLKATAQKARYPLAAIQTCSQFK